MNAEADLMLLSELADFLNAGRIKAFEQVEIMEQVNLDMFEPVFRGIFKVLFRGPVVDEESEFKVHVSFL